MGRTFWIGAIGYPVIELLWRRRTHPAMALCGGLALCGLKRIHQISKNRPLWLASLLGGGMVTGIEYLTGMLLNRQYRIWDYRRQPFQLNGQICLGFSLAWCALSAAALVTMRAFARR